jgi:hypothetical protein
MGVIFEHFAAPSNAVAADLVDTGPAGPMPASPALQDALRTGDREALRQAMRPRVRVRVGSLGVVDQGIDPVVQIGTLEALMAGYSYEPRPPSNACIW